MKKKNKLFLIALFFLPFSSFAKDKICHLGDKKIDGVPACGVKVAFFGPVSRRNFDFNLKTYPICERFGKKNIFEKYTFISTQGEKVGERLIPEGKLGKYEKCRDQAGDFYKKRFYMVGFKEKVIGTTLVFSEKVEVEDFKSYYKDFDFKKVEGSELEKLKERLESLIETLGWKYKKRNILSHLITQNNQKKVSFLTAESSLMKGLSFVEGSPTKINKTVFCSAYLFVMNESKLDYFGGETDCEAYLLGEFRYKGIRYLAYGGYRSGFKLKLFYKINNKIYVKTVHDINDHLTF
ncbi:MAG: hypothetical protein CME66_11850 [Halobacteriovoraceae bacterium]|nr:hypothetical protein [Halobacteriovoraceae bacterium]